MPIRTVRLQGFDAFANDLAALETGLTADAIIVHMQQALDVLQTIIQNLTPVNFGLLRGSIFNQMSGTPVNLTGIVATPIIYGEPVEIGRQVGTMPPIDAIQLWVVRKGIVFFNNETGSALSERATAFLIARAISEGRSRGIANTGAHMFRDGTEQAIPRINQIWDNLLVEITGILSNE